MGVQGTPGHDRFLTHDLGFIGLEESSPHCMFFPSGSFTGVQKHVSQWQFTCSRRRVLMTCCCDVAQHQDFQYPKCRCRKPETAACWDRLCPSLHTCFTPCVFTQISEPLSGEDENGYTPVMAAASWGHATQLSFDGVVTWEVPGSTAFGRFGRMRFSVSSRTCIRAFTDGQTAKAEFSKISSKVRKVN